MKIIAVDNLNRDWIPDKLICENINAYYGRMIVDLLNEGYASPSSMNFYKLVQDDYPLYEGDN